MKIKNKWLFAGIAITTFLFILLGEGSISYVMGGDTEAYYLNFHHHIGVAPGYPLFIHIVEMIFGEKFYLHIVAALQMLLLAGAVTYLVYTVWDLFSLRWWETLIIWIFAMLPFVMLLPEDPIGHTLMTESLTYPLFYIFIAILLRGVIRKRERVFVYGLLYAMLMAWIRPQMQFTFAVDGIAYFYVVVRKRLQNGKTREIIKSWYGRTFLCFIVVLLCMKIVSGATAVYEKVFFDAPALDYSDQTLVQRLLYVAEEADEMLFECEELREIYRTTWSEMQKAETTQQYYDRDWKNWSEIFKAFGANSYILGDVIREKLAEEETLANDVIGQEMQISEISHELTMVLMKAHWREHLLLTFQLLPKSFISTVFFHKTSIYNLILVATIFVYLFAVLGSLFAFGKNRKTKAAELMLLIVGTSTINALACDLVLAGLQRYMAYTMGMTWIGVFLLLKELWGSRGSVK